MAGKIVTADDAFRDWLARLSKAGVRCRKLGHQWPDEDDKRAVFTGSRKMGLVMVEMPCIRGCGVVREAYIATPAQLDAAGITNPNRYTYEDPEYLFRGGTVKTPGTNVGREHRDAITETYVSLIPDGSIKWVD